MKSEKRSRGWFVTDIQGDILDIYIWCQKLYGPCGLRWEHYSGSFLFQQEADMTMFMLRWA